MTEGDRHLGENILGFHGGNAIVGSLGLIVGGEDHVLDQGHSHFAHVLGAFIFRLH